MIVYVFCIHSCLGYKQHLTCKFSPKSYCANPQLCQWAMKTVALESGAEDALHIDIFTPITIGQIEGDIGAELIKKLGIFIEGCVRKILSVLADVSLGEEVKQLANGDSDTKNDLIDPKDDLLCSDTRYSTKAFFKQLGCGFFKEMIVSSNASHSNPYIQGGVIKAKKNAETEKTSKSSKKENLTYLDFAPLPYLLEDHKSTAPTETKEVDFQLLPIPTFAQTADKFFSQLEIQKREEARQQKTKKALSKVERIKQDHEERVKKMEQIQNDAENKAELLLEHQELGRDHFDVGLMLV